MYTYTICVYLYIYIYIYTYIHTCIYIYREREICQGKTERRNLHQGLPAPEENIAVRARGPNRMRGRSL